jgi:hypothetical protein
MKFYVFLILYVFCYTIKAGTEQAIRLSPNKLLIPNSKEDPLQSPGPFEKDISDMNFSTKLKDAETALYRKLTTHNFLKNNFNSTAPYRLDYFPTYRIDKITTLIDLKQNKTFADINEKVTFTLENGIFSSISRKISLAGSSDSLVAFRLSSR